MIITNNSFSQSFGYNNILKTLYRKGELNIQYGFYGGKLSQKNVSLEHLKPFSKGGKTNLDNLVLATKENNRIRGNFPLKNFIDINATKQYLAQFSGIAKDGFNGNNYIQRIIHRKSKFLFL